MYEISAPRLLISLAVTAAGYLSVPIVAALLYREMTYRAFRVVCICWAIVAYLAFGLVVDWGGSDSIIRNYSPAVIWCSIGLLIGRKITSKREGNVPPTNKKRKLKSQLSEEKAKELNQIHENKQSANKKQSARFVVDKSTGEVVGTVRRKKDN